MRCYLCDKPLLLGEEVQRLPRPDKVQIGEKSGQLGVYPSPDYQEDEQEIIIHSKCCPAFFDPESNPHLYDEYAEKIREAVTHDVYSEVEDHFQNHCTKCGDPLEDVQEPENPNCLWCKTNVRVWTMNLRDTGIIYRCDICNHYWNEFEEELVLTG